MGELYDRIGSGYAGYRRPDPRIAAAIGRALGTAETVVNVGAGTGSYEPVDRRVTAVEPSQTMLAQRRSGAAPAVRARASALPFADASFYAALAILTIHHWDERARSFAELARVARERVVILTWDPDAWAFWLTDDYFPEIAALDRERTPTLSELERAFGPLQVEHVGIPHDCSDGFLAAYWRRPEAYLDAAVRSPISSFRHIPDPVEGLRRLEADLRSGEWERRHGHVRGLAELDPGYRLVTALLR